MDKTPEILELFEKYQDQMQRFEAMVTRIEKSVGPKTWKKKIMNVVFGRMAILSMVGAYFYLGGSNPEVVSFDKMNGIVSIKGSNDSIENLIWNGSELMKGDKALHGDFAERITNSILLGLEIVGLEDDSNWF